MEQKNKVEEPAVSYGEITSLDQLDLSLRYSYADYFKWKFRERVELIKGYIHKMSPTPGPLHQRILSKLHLNTGNYFEDHPCSMWLSPFDVRMPDSKKKTDDKEVFTVVQPDLCVVCDPDKIDRRGCIGAPDLVVEILSPGNTKKEMGIKFDLYEENGVKEYWIVEPTEKVIYAYILKNGRFKRLKPFIEDDVMQSHLFPDLKFEVKKIFD